MKHRDIAIAVALAFAGACGRPGSNLTGPDSVLSSVRDQAAKPTSPNLVGDVTLHSGLGYVAAPLVSTCPGTVASNYSVQFKHSQCLVFRPTGASYDLTDDVAVNVTLKRGAVTQIQIRAQDVIGPDGVQHETDQIPISPPTLANAAGFILHVHADQVPVYRLSGHIGGAREGVIGTMSIWDVVYRAP